MKKKIAIFASGTGSNAEKIIRHFKNNKWAEVALILSNKNNAGVLQIAEQNNLPTHVFNKKELEQGDQLLKTLRAKNTDWIVLAGFLLKIPTYLIAHYPGRIINIHPALLPAYGGKGMYGAHVHEAVIKAGETESGITIHYIDQNYDRGEIILQKKCTVQPEDTPKSLAQKIQQLEHQWFPQTIEKIIRENVKK